MNLPFNKHVLITLVLLIAVVVFGVIVLMKEPVVEPSVFISHLAQSPKVVIVQDLRGATSDLIRKNIQQCGVDFAGSQGLARKELVISAYEKDLCITMEGTFPISKCESEYATLTKIFISAGKETRFFNDKMIVGVQEQYVPLDCRVNIVS